MNQAIERLYKRRRFGIKPGLDVELKLLETLGNPHERYPSVHIAGTNGKGSVAAMVASILRCAGYRTGLYTSPHLVKFNERFTVDGIQIGDAELARAIERIEVQIPVVAGITGKEPTFFECSTAIAFDHFAARGVDVAVLETGMGGRLDATNVVTPMIAVVTRIGLEHTAFLGSDLESIAAEKAGIVKRGRPVVCGMMDPAARAVVREAALAAGCAFVDAEQTVTARICSESLKGQTLAIETEGDSYGRVRLPVAGRHQVENVVTAVAAAETLNSHCGLSLGGNAVKQGMEALNWPGRFQLIREVPPEILDGAHNPDAARALVATLKKLAPRSPVGLVAGMCADKDARGFLSEFRDTAGRLWTVPLRNQRGMPPDELRSIGETVGLCSETSELPQALQAARDWALDAQGVICICGSLFLVGEVLEIEGEHAEV